MRKKLLLYITVFNGMFCFHFVPLRYAATDFTVPYNCTVHGFAGTFECNLYKNVLISTAPHSHTEGMFSWFPLFIPLAAPLRVNKGDVLTADVWR